MSGKDEPGDAPPPAPPETPREPTVGTDRSGLPEEADLKIGPFGRTKKGKLKDKHGMEHRGHGDPTHPVRLRAMEKARDIYEKRLAGWSLRELSYDYDVSPGLISKIIAKEMARVQKAVTKDAASVRTLVEERTEFLWRALHPQMAKGNARSVEMGLRILERIAKLHGLDAPEKHQVDLDVNLSDAEVLVMARRAGLAVPPEVEAALGGAPLEALPGITPDVLPVEFTVRESTHAPAGPEEAEAPPEAAGERPAGP